MKFKEIEVWCNERACDGCWGMLTAMVCIDLIEKMRNVPFWKREKVWKEKYEQHLSCLKNNFNVMYLDDFIK